MKKMKSVEVKLKESGKEANNANVFQILSYGVIQIIRKAGSTKDCGTN